jgi:hypothetical protein
MSTLPKDLCIFTFENKLCEIWQRKSWITENNELGPNLQKLNSFEFSMEMIPKTSMILVASHNNENECVCVTIMSLERWVLGI